MKRLICKIELVEEQDNYKPIMVSNLIVMPDKNGNYGFYYEENNKLIKLHLKNIKITEVAELDSVQQLLLENKMSKVNKTISKCNH